MPYIPQSQINLAQAYIQGLKSKVQDLEEKLSVKNKEIEELKSSRCDPYIPEEDPYQN
jgi:peptidoglycan hydrolase CwlO-like protein